MSFNFQKAFMYTWGKFATRVFAIRPRLLVDGRFQVMRVISLIDPSPSFHKSFKFCVTLKTELIRLIPNWSKPAMMARLPMRLAGLVSWGKCSCKFDSLQSVANEPPTKTITLKPSNSLRFPHEFKPRRRLQILDLEKTSIFRCLIGFNQKRCYSITNSDKRLVGHFKCGKSHYQHLAHVTNNNNRYNNKAELQWASFWHSFRETRPNSRTWAERPPVICISEKFWESIAKYK